MLHSIVFSTECVKTNVYLIDATLKFIWLRLVRLYEMPFTLHILYSGIVWFGGTHWGLASVYVVMC